MLIIHLFLLLVNSFKNSSSKYLYLSLNFFNKLSEYCPKPIIKRKLKIYEIDKALLHSKDHLNSYQIY